MFCGKCGSKLNDSEKFCGKCGNAVQQEQMQYSNATPTLFVQPIVKNSKIKNKKSLVVVLCSIALAVSVVLGVIFIPDWDTDVYVDNGLPSKEQTEFSYIPIYTETSSNVDEESTTDENKSKITKKEKKTTRKNNEGEITTSVTEEPEMTTRVAISETTTNKGENSSITDSTTKKPILDDLSEVDLRDIYPGIDQTLGPGGSLNEIDWESVIQDYEKEN